jgi:predicted TIM-barrel fold metal-dependent hydrolase
MLDGIPLIDAHIHAARIPTVRVDWALWADLFGKSEEIRRLYNEDGSIDPARFDAYLEAEGVDVAILVAEYSPRVTGIQPVEDFLPLLECNPKRFKFLANINPYFHHPVKAELKRQLGLGAVGLKIHPVHGGFAPNDRMLYPAYALCEEEGVPVVFHCGTSIFPGASNRFADPAPIEDVLRDFPGLKVALAHGSRGWWYGAAAFMALMRESVYIELSGLPPKKLAQYYAGFDLSRLAQKFIFGTDWPGVPGIRQNAEAIAGLGFDRETLEKIFYKNAMEFYAGLVCLRGRGPGG